jgi:hypothetical protein
MRSKHRRSASVEGSALHYSKTLPVYISTLLQYYATVPLIGDIHETTQDDKCDSQTNKHTHTDEQVDTKARQVDRQ